jgi:hypothetical protein
MLASFLMVIGGYVSFLAGSNFRNDIFGQGIVLTIVAIGLYRGAFYFNDFYDQPRS